MTIDYLMMGILCFILGIVFGASGLKMVDGQRMLVGTPEILIDYDTGCHYLTSGYRGGIIPRLDEFGHHICLAQDGQMFYGVFAGYGSSPEQTDAALDDFAASRGGQQQPETNPMNEE